MKYRAALIAPVLAASLVTACTGAEDGPPSIILAGSPEAAAVLAFLNDAETTFGILDDEVPLDRRAAANLIAHRDGPDGASGTADDDLFDDLDEVDAVKYVGDAALGQLADYAIDNGYGVELDPDDVLGIFEGVTFTVIEAEKALYLVNNASDAVLDVEVGLNSRTVTNIIDARPIGSMQELADTPWVGPASMQLIHDQVATPTLDEPRECRHDGECFDSRFYCAGIPDDPTMDKGFCRPKDPLPGEGGSCSSSDPCGTGLVCAGLSAASTGECVPSWAAASFDQTISRTIATDGTMVFHTYSVNGLLDATADAHLAIELDHTRKRNLIIELLVPNKQLFVLWDGPSSGTTSFPGAWDLSGVVAGLPANGFWAVRIRNVGGSGSGALRSSTLSLITTH